MDFDKVKVATSSDLAAVCQFYQDVCAHQSRDEYGAEWTWGDYPSEAGLRKAAAGDQVLIGIIAGQVAAAGVLTAGEDYPTIHWPHQFPNDAIGILHLYALHPDFRGQGLASSLLQAILHHARDDGKQVVHLDVLAGNVPAAKLYQKNGFTVVSRQVYHYDDLGDRPAILMEHLL